MSRFEWVQLFKVNFYGGEKVIDLMGKLSLTVNVYLCKIKTQANRILNLPFLLPIYVRLVPFRSDA